MSEPTPAQIAAAEDTLRRRDEAEAAKRAEAIKPISDITSSEAFATLRDAVFGLPVEYLADAQIGPHVMCMRTGLNGLATIAPPPAPVNPAPTGSGE